MPSKPEFPEEYFDAESGRVTGPSHEGTSATNDSLIFVGFNSRVIALDRHSGKLVWDWKSPKGSGFVAVLLDVDRLIVSVQGYTYCLDPNSGTCLWSNPLSGMGVGIPCVASSRGSTLAWSSLAQIESDQQQAHHQQQQSLHAQQMVHQQHHQQFGQ